MTTIEVQASGSILTLTLNRPDSLNALNNALLVQLGRALEEGLRDTAVRSIVLTGSGNKAFCAGVDLTERTELDDDGKHAQSRAILDIVRAVYDAPKPIIASINGWCLGAGLELALACDIRIASDSARFGFPEMGLGAYPGAGGAVLLPRLIGRARALDWFINPRRLNASEALELGVITRLSPAEALSAATSAVAEKASQLAPLAAAALKKSLNCTEDVPIAQAFEFDQSVRRPLDGSLDYREGLNAARDKRQPVFTGR